MSVRAWFAHGEFRRRVALTGNCLSSGGRPSIQWGLFIQKRAFHTVRIFSYRGGVSYGRGHFIRQGAFQWKRLLLYFQAFMCIQHHQTTRNPINCLRGLIFSCPRCASSLIKPPKTLSIACEVCTFYVFIVHPTSSNHSKPYLYHY